MHKYTETDEKQSEHKVIKDFKQNDNNQAIVDQMRGKREELGKPEEKKEQTKTTPKVVAKKEQTTPKETKEKSRSVMDILSDQLKNKKKEPVPKKVKEDIPPQEELNKKYQKKSKKQLERIDAFNKLFDKKEETPIEKPTPEVKKTPKVELKPIEEVIKQPTVSNKDIQDSPPPRPATDIVVRKNQNPEKIGKIVAGWLVVHTEDRPPVLYELFEGNNIIGRPDGPHHVDIKIGDDRYVSRIHCSILVKKDYLHRFIHVLQDGSGLDRTRKSTNGTFINGFEQRLLPGQTVYLRDGDTVQAGETKLAFKNTDESNDYEQAANSVLQTDYTKTVAINYKPS